VKSWLRNGESALSTVRSRRSALDDDSLLEELIQENVLLQLHHLRTHPSVAGALAKGELELSGWVYDIGDGVVRVYDEEQRKFLQVTGHQKAGSGAAQK
jgi:Carbonic anhydrase